MAPESSEVCTGAGTSDGCSALSHSGRKEFVWGHRRFRARPLGASLDDARLERGDGQQAEEQRLIRVARSVVGIEIGAARAAPAAEHLFGLAKGLVGVPGYRVETAVEIGRASCRGRV